MDADKNDAQPDPIDGDAATPQDGPLEMPDVERDVEPLDDAPAPDAPETAGWRNLLPFVSFIFAIVVTPIALFSIPVAALARGAVSAMVVPVVLGVILGQLSLHFARTGRMSFPTLAKWAIGANILAIPFWFILLVTVWDVRGVRDDDPSVDALSLADVAVGDCLNVDTTLGSLNAPGALAAVACDAPHDAQVYEKQLVSVPEGFPGETEMDAQARAICNATDALARVSTEEGAPSLGGFSRPTAETWGDANSGYVVCMVAAAEPLTGSWVSTTP